MDPVELEFLLRWNADREADVSRSLGEYLALFPGHEAAVARAYCESVEVEPKEPLADREAPPGERYRIRSTLGRGGMGTVSLATDEQLDREVAVKMPHDHRATFEVHREQLFAEARTTARLRHPALPPVHDLGVDRRGRPFYVMRRLEGRSFAEVMRDDDGESALHRHLWILRRASLAVAFAHAHDVLHLDLKPANIMLGEFGEVLVVDWGLARVGSDAPLDRIAGTPGYMPPEQISGDPVTTASDLFALGATLYELLLGVRPFVGDSTDEVFRRTRAGSFARTSRFEELPSELRRLVEEALDPNSTAKLDCAEEFGARLERYLEGERDLEVRRAEADRAVERARGEHGARAQQHLRAERLARKIERNAPTVDAPLDERRAHWRREDELATLRAEADDHLRTAEEQLETALRRVPDHADARALLADVTFERWQQARREHQDLAERYYAERLRRLEQPKYEEFLSGEGRLSVGIEGDGWTARLEQRSEGAVIETSLTSGVLQFGKRSGLVTTPDPFEPFPVRRPAGRYRLRLERGEEEHDVPLLLEAGTHVELELRPPTADDLADGFAWIPGGRFSMGGDPSALAAAPATQVALPEFAMAKLPITFEEYGEFLRELPPAVARRRRPRSPSGDPLPLLLPDLGYRAPERRGTTRHRLWPVFGISDTDAMAYARWRSKRDGRKVTLPTGAQWEKAARGVDGRRFPFGDRFDPALALTRRSRERRAQPDVVGAFPHDRSPYGVRDLAGGVCEWCRDWFDHRGGKRLVKGGSWSRDEADARAASRQGVATGSCYAFLGFRLVHEISRRT